MSRQFVSPLAIRDGFAYGWARRDGQRQVEVHLWLDGRHVATEYTGASLPAFCHAACGTPPAGAGFVFALPQGALDGFPHELHAALPAADGESLHGEVQSYERGTVRGEVRQQGRQFLGTVWFKTRAPRRPRLELRDDAGNIVSRLALAVSSSAGKHGYPAQFAVPCESLPHGTLHFSCRGQALRGSPCARRSSVLGVLEQADAGGVVGWAFDSAELGRPLELCLRIDGRALTWFRPNTQRPEIEARLGQAEGRVGLIGFRLPLPACVADGGWHRLEVVAADDGQPLSEGHRMVRVERPWIEHRPTRRGGRSRPATATRGHTTPPPPQVSVVVLNRNGGPVLSAFLESWERHNTVPAEVIVVDHASTDGSLALLDGWTRRLALKVLALDRNDSFSSSCNLGARHARGDYLLFVNNDIVWLQDALPRMLESLQSPQTGIVGLKLLKAVGESQHAVLPATEVQHLGVRFKLNEAGYWPYEIAPAPAGGEDEHAPQLVPAVTGAALLCRKSDFDQVGGFDTGYFYGFEDVELCLRLSQRLRKVVVCRNDVCALHRHGHTRLSGRELALFDRVQRNAQVLQADAGLWLKQAYWRSLLQGDGYLTTEALTIGIVVDGPSPEGAPSTLAGDAARLAALLDEAIPHARVVFLPPERGWKNVSDLHVLVVGTPRYDLRAVHGARADLLTVAWVRSQPRQWTTQPWWLAFGGYLGPARVARTNGIGGVHVATPTAAAPLGSLLDVTQWRMRVAVRVPLAAADLGGGCATAMRARALRLALKGAGFPCWLLPLEDWDTAGAMSDACITLQTARSHPGTPRPDVLNVLWLCDGAAKPRHWRARHGLVTRQQPTPRMLLEAMEKSVGNTFRPS